MEAESYANEQVADFIHRHFLPVTINIKQSPSLFHRFDVLWTPSVLFLDSSGVEQFRLEGYLPRKEFSAQLQLALGRIAFMHKQWADAESHYSNVADKYADTASAAEAIYWSGVSHYKRTNDHTVLGTVGQQLNQKFPQNLWTEKASVWLSAAPQSKTA